MSFPEARWGQRMPQQPPTTPLPQTQETDTHGNEIGVPENFYSQIQGRITPVLEYCLNIGLILSIFQQAITVFSSFPASFRAQVPPIFANPAAFTIQTVALGGIGVTLLSNLWNLRNKRESLILGSAATIIGASLYGYDPIGSILQRIPFPTLAQTCDPENYLFGLSANAFKMLGLALVAGALAKNCFVRYRQNRTPITAHEATAYLSTAMLAASAPYLAKYLIDPVVKTSLFLSQQYAFTPISSTYELFFQNLWSGLWFQKVYSLGALLGTAGTLAVLYPRIAPLVQQSPLTKKIYGFLSFLIFLSPETFSISADRIALSALIPTIGKIFAETVTHSPKLGLISSFGSCAIFSIFSYNAYALCSSIPGEMLGMYVGTRLAIYRAQFQNIFERFATR